MSLDISKLPGSGRFILSAHLKAKSSEDADKLEGWLSGIKNNIERGNEPGCHTYRISRFETRFIVFEEYNDLKALDEHHESEAFRTFKAVVLDLCVEPPLVEYYREVI